MANTDNGSCTYDTSSPIEIKFYGYNYYYLVTVDGSFLSGQDPDIPLISGQEYSLTYYGSSSHTIKIYNTTGELFRLYNNLPQTYTFTDDEINNLKYICIYHSWMIGDFISE